MRIFILLLLATSCFGQDFPKISKRPDPVTDKPFWISTAVMVVTTTMDTEQSTGFGPRGCSELNPIVGPKPSSLKLRAVSYGGAAFVGGATYLIRRHVRHQNPYGKMPKIVNLPLWVVSVGHTAGFVLTQANGCGW